MHDKDGEEDLDLDGIKERIARIFKGTSGTAVSYKTIIAAFEGLRGSSASAHEVSVSLAVSLLKQRTKGKMKEKHLQRLCQHYVRDDAAEMSGTNGYVTISLMCLSI